MKNKILLIWTLYIILWIPLIMFLISGIKSDKDINGVLAIFFFGFTILVIIAPLIDYFIGRAIKNLLKETLIDFMKSDNFFYTFINRHFIIAIPNDKSGLGLVLRKKSYKCDEYFIPRENIISANIEVTKQEVLETIEDPSAKGVIGGAMVGGIVGAIIGGALYTNKKSYRRLEDDKVLLHINQSKYNPNTFSLIFGKAQEYSSNLKDTNLQTARSVFSKIQSALIR